MTKIVVFSDLHMRPAPPAGRPDPLASLERGLAHAVARQGDAEAVVFCGDLAHDGDAASYRRLKRLLEKTDLPIHPMLGNHDDRDTFRAVFPEVPTDPAGFVQRVVDLPGVRLVLLDTLHAAQPDDPLRHAGRLCPARLDWMEARLAETAMPCIVFMHHPPHATGFPAMDRIALRDGAAFHDRLARHDHVRLLVCGHIHRTISGCHRGLPFCVFKSPVGQMPMDFETLDSSIECGEPAAYGILLSTPEGVIVHSEDYGLAPALDAGP